MQGQRKVGADGRGVCGRAFVGQRGFQERRGGGLGRGRRDDGGGKAGFSVAPLEKVVHALATHHRF